MSSIPESESNFPAIRSRKSLKALEFEKRMSLRSLSTQHLRAKWLDPAELAKEVLTNCNYIHKKKENVPVLRKGEGRTTSNPDRTLREIYEGLHLSIEHGNRSSAMTK
jgi:hypothetical protein